MKIKQDQPPCLLIWICLSLIVIIPGVWITGKYLVIPVIDANQCIPRAAERIGVEASYASIIEWINSSLIPGLPREEVHTKLEKIAHIVVFDPIIIQDREYSETTVVQICSKSSNIIVIAIYNSQDRLVSFQYDNFP